ncbi:MAG: hypothetical protein EOM10_05535 [Opitutae bacterium]|nr:hypothetical protein [Opitutae bacterium]
MTKHARKENLEAMKKDVTEMNGTMEEVKVYLAKLQKNVDRLNKQIAPEMEEIQEGVSQLQKKLGSVQEHVEEMKTAIGKNK